jgi:hypothetical protein
MDAAALGDVEAGRRILAELEAIHPRWRDHVRAVALRPDTPPLQEILGE